MSSEAADGGPAFPVPKHALWDGLSLRDLVSLHVYGEMLGAVYALGGKIEAKDVAVEAFIAADAWLKARAVI